MDFNEPVNTLYLLNDIIENIKVGDTLNPVGIVDSIDLIKKMVFLKGVQSSVPGCIPLQTQIRDCYDLLGYRYLSYTSHTLHLKLRPILEELLTRDNQLKEQINLLLQQREDDGKRIETLESDYKQLLTNMSTITEYMKRTNKLEQTIIKLEEQHVRLEEKMVEFEEGETIILKKQS